VTVLATDPPADIPSAPRSSRGFSRAEAFARNIGLITEREQALLEKKCVAIPGLGGVGGIHAVTLARLGIGRFHLADADAFEIANINRQIGATMSTLGRPKTEVITEMIKDINPEASVEVYNHYIDAANVETFLQGVDIVVDGLDFFALSARRALFKVAANRGLYTITAGPIGFSCPMLIFSPRGMGFDEYFGFSDGQSDVKQRNRFAVGLTPRSTHLPYLPLSKDIFKEAKGPSLALATDLCAGMAATEVVRILLDRGRVKAVPHWVQFDAYRRLYKKGYRVWGYRNPLQRVKIWYLDWRFH
jgi:molybdopterin/thiamine biosynthesis adenylyltransferase